MLMQKISIEGVFPKQKFAKSIPDAWLMITILIINNFVSDACFDILKNCSPLWEIML